MGRASASRREAAELDASAITTGGLAVAAIWTNVRQLMPWPEEGADLGGDADGVQFLALGGILPIHVKGINTGLYLKRFLVRKGEVDDLRRCLQVFFDMGWGQRKLAAKTLEALPLGVLGEGTGGAGIVLDAEKIGDGVGVFFTAQAIKRHRGALGHAGGFAFFDPCG